jgi:hypothetical protein
MKIKSIILFLWHGIAATTVAMASDGLLIFIVRGVDAPGRFLGGMLFEALSHAVAVLPPLAITSYITVVSIRILRVKIKHKALIVIGPIIGGSVTVLATLYYYFVFSGGTKAEYRPFYERIYGIAIPTIAGTIMGGMVGWLSKQSDKFQRVDGV